MQYFFVTGSNRGLGKALVDALLALPQAQVFGISRKAETPAPNFHPIRLDLTDTEATANFQFPNIEQADKLVLINNAGQLGEVSHLGNQQPDNFANVLKVNLIAPGILVNAFINKYKSLKAEKLIINITSGAANSPYDGWSAYCSSKAGLDMLTKVAAEEQVISKLPYPFIILGIAPGVVDTGMQAQLRVTDHSQFSRGDKFHELYREGKLYAPEAVAQKLKDIILNPAQVKETISRIQL
ncbi:MAG: SDR family NAD(P)-dependent oxidoreductase [Chitinophagales bacterium]|nr:SDR family NAD(P)-dependent oxidoreductase [Chitinophagales bacterium]